MEEVDQSVNVEVRSSDTTTVGDSNSSLKPMDILFDDDIIKGKFPRRIGNCIALLYKNRNPIITIGPDWMFYMVLMSILGVAYPIFLIYVASHAPKAIYYIGYVVFFSFVGSYSYTSFRNPGIVMKRVAMFDDMYIEKIKDDARLYCKICNIIKKPNSEIQHCFDCDLCVDQYDHHCPWVGKCVGRNNLISFYIFLGSLFGLIFYLMLGIITGVPNMVDS